MSNYNVIVPRTDEPLPVKSLRIGDAFLFDGDEQSASNLRGCIRSHRRKFPGKRIMVASANKDDVSEVRTWICWRSA
jgi:hypothetical protein